MLPCQGKAGTNVHWSLQGIRPSKRSFLSAGATPELSDFHDVFHVSELWKCLQLPDKTEVFKNIDHRSIDLNQDLTYRERPLRILEETVRVTRS
jgi:hypothetical protein